MSKRPAEYAAPLKSRTDIINFLAAHTSYGRGSHRECSPLAWNVKCYTVYFDADNLIKLYREFNDTPAPWLDYPEWLEPAKAKLAEAGDNLWEYALEDARLPLTEEEQHLWDGTTVKVAYGFSGRSGGWLIIQDFEGVDLTDMNGDDFVTWMKLLNYNALRNLYRLVVQNDHDYRRQGVKEALEFAAAFSWIENLCADVVRPDMTQSQLALA